VRELENILHRAVALSDQPELALDETESPTSETVTAQLNPLPADLQSHLDAQERAILLRALQHTGFNRTSAAQLLGLSLRQMRYRIARLKIDMPADAHWGPSEDANESS
jgi:two-component system response regulator PilR (NtrC family)